MNIIIKKKKKHTNRNEYMMVQNAWHIRMMHINVSYKKNKCSSVTENIGNSVTDATECRKCCTNIYYKYQPLFPSLYKKINAFVVFSDQLLKNKTIIFSVTLA